jgi:uncharacterized protein with HEPN domain
MSRHDTLLRVTHMRDHAREAVEMAGERKRDDLDQDRMLNLALVRLIEVIGEATTRVPLAFRERYPDVPWQQIVGMRNRLVHGYDSVDFDILWTIIQDDLPALIVQLNNILSKED